MNHIKQKKQPLSLKSMKKSLSKLKQRPRTSGTVLTVLPKVRSSDYPKAPDSVRLQQKDGINSDGSNGPPTFRPSTASTSHPFASKKVEMEDPARIVSKAQRSEFINTNDGPGLAYFPQNETDSSHFPAPDESSEASRKMHQEIQAQALRCLQICGSNYSSSGSSIQTLEDEQNLAELDESSINLPKKNSRPRSVASAGHQQYMTAQPVSRAYESSSQLVKRPIDWDTRKPSNHNPQEYQQDVDLMIQNVNQSSLSSLMRASSASVHQFEVMRNSKSSSGRETIVQRAKDWAFSALCTQVKENRIEFGRKLVQEVYRQEEIDYTATMLRHRHVELSRSDLLLPIFERARNTLFELMNELLLSAKVQKIRLKYQIPSLENTFRFLFKSKKLFTARSRVIQILKLLIRRKEISQELNNRLKEADSILQDDSRVDELFELTKFHKNQLHILTRLILNLQQDFKFLKQRFLYYGEDVLVSMKQELQNIQLRMRQAILFTHD